MILPTLHCSLNSTRRPARADLLLQVKSPKTKPTKPSRPSGTRSRIKNAANTPTTPNSSPALSTPALRPLTYPPGHREHQTRPRGRPFRRLRRPRAGHAPTQRDRGGDPRHDRQHADPIGVAGHSPRSARRAAARRIVTSPTSTLESPVSRAGRLRPRRCRLDTGPRWAGRVPVGTRRSAPSSSRHRFPHPVERICSTLLA
jgi:hypothetical protein